MQFSIVIPTYNNLAELRRCLEALDQIQEPSFEVMVCVDGSTDGTLEWLETAELQLKMQVLTHPGNQNRGRAATRNLARDTARGIYTLFLDSDMESPGDLLRSHEAVLAPGNTISIGTVHYRNTGSNVWVRYTSERGVAKYPPGSEVPFQYFITPNTALPTQMWREVGGFDEIINRYGGEDMELGYRIHRKFAPRFIFNAAATVVTTQPKTLWEALPQLKEYGGSGLPYIVRKWPELSNIYWVDRIGSKKFKDRLFCWLARPWGRKIVRGLFPLLPYSLKKHLINYLVISYVHEGFREAW